MQQF
jgi:hypothetical protein